MLAKKIYILGCGYHQGIIVLTERTSNSHVFKILALTTSFSLSCGALLCNPNVFKDHWGRGVPSRNTSCERTSRDRPPYLPAPRHQSRRKQPDQDGGPAHPL